jgi:hypothetical protein
MVKKVNTFDNIYSLGKIAEIISDYPHKKALLRDIVFFLKSFDKDAAIKQKQTKQKRKAAKPTVNRKPRKQQQATAQPLYYSASSAGSCSSSVSSHSSDRC